MTDASCPTIVRTPQVDFHVQTRGSLPRVVFVHGLGGDLHTWDDVWAATPELSALRYDLRNCGQSIQGQSAPYKHADDLLALLDASGIERCDLIGVSQGASIALNFTLDHPQRVDKLILLSPGLIGWEWSQLWHQLWQPIATSAATGALDIARRLWWEHPLFATTRNSAAGQALFQSIMRMSAQQWIETDHMLMLPDVERLHLLTTPTLLMSGVRDLDDFRLIADLIEASGREIRRIDYSQCGHLLHLEDPAACARDIRAFLQHSR
jgi:pimeloyl-ACP methyl ester carboxylesterase